MKLSGERRSLQLGAKIKTRLWLYFFAISIMPIVAMAVFSYLFLNRALERWFTSIPSNVIVEAREVQNQAIKSQAEKLSHSAQMLAVSLDRRDFTNEDLQRIAEAGNLTHIEILSKAYKTIAVYEKNIGAEQKAEVDNLLEIVRSGRTSETILLDSRGFDAAIAEFSDGRKLVIMPDLYSEENVSQMVESSLAKFQELKQSEVKIRQIGLSTLGVLTFMLIFASSWTALYIARGLTVPIKALAEGAEEIAHGKLGHRVDVPAEDELALLVSAFNDMSSKLEANSAELTERRRYIETVLLSLPTGVISVDSEDRVDTINPAARLILLLEPGKYRGAKFIELLNNEDREPFIRLIARAKRIGHASDQIKLRGTALENNERRDGSPMAITATALPDIAGAVLVIEDLSELIAAQRASAWQEVARRMAHEIKNPLTPIQLAAERIAKRFAESGRLSVVSGQLGTGSVVDGKDGRMKGVVEEGTATIIREVQSLKSMVDEFSRFARLPNANPEAGDLNEVIDQVLALYR